MIYDFFYPFRDAQAPFAAPPPPSYGPVLYTLLIQTLKRSKCIYKVKYKSLFAYQCELAYRFRSKKNFHSFFNCIDEPHICPNDLVPRPTIEKGSVL